MIFFMLNMELSQHYEKAIIHSKNMNDQKQYTTLATNCHHDDHILHLPRDIQHLNILSIV